MGASGCWPLKVSKQVRLVERKVWFISDAGKGGRRVVDICPKADSASSLPAEQAGGGNFYKVGRGLHAETTQPSLTVICRLVLSGLTSVLLIVLGTVNLRLWARLLPFLCSQLSELWQRLATLWPSRGYLLHWVFWYR